jgi:hypothetical protein
MHVRVKLAVLVGLGLPVMAMLATTGLAGAHGGDPSKVHACVVPASGTIRIIDPGQSCYKNESPLDWTLNAGTAYSAGLGLALSPGNEFSVTGAPWAGLTGVPAGFADGMDDNGADQVAQLRRDLSSGGITSGWISDGTISAADLAGTDSSDPAKVVVGAVTSEKIFDGTVQSRDLDRELIDRLRTLEDTVAALEVRVAAIEAQ